jgi:(p)ppGpp synthase/HD superfamily hydrolase
MMFATGSARAWGRIVEACSDSLADTGKGERKVHWRERKEAYLAHLRTADEDILRVSLADKVHNARTILRDLRKPDIGEKVWARFNVPAPQSCSGPHAALEIPVPP